MNNSYEELMEKVMGVIVIYNCSIESSESLSTLNKSLLISNLRLDLFIYDNSTIPGINKETGEREFPQLNITYLSDTQNPGVSKAYNTGADLASRLNKKWLLLLDQDTEFPENAIVTYLDAINAHKNQKLFVPVLHSPNGNYSPCKYYFKAGFRWNDIKPGIYNLRHKNILNSGTLVDLDLFMKTGGYKEKIKLYFSDFNFIDRLKKINNEFVVTDLVCNHKLSDIINVDRKAAINRFKSYCEGSYESVESWIDYILLFITVMLRSFVLCYRFKSLVFMKIFFNVYLRL